MTWAVNGVSWLSAGRGRLDSRKGFLFAAQWNDKYYDTKQVRPIFVAEEDEIVVVTVYTYYF